MDIQVEPLKKCIVEMNAILLEYWNATEARMGVPPLDMDWDHYADTGSSTATRADHST